MNPVRIAIAGATGRMGCTLVRLIAADERLRLTAAYAERGDPRLGFDAGVVAGVGDLAVPIRSEGGEAADVVIEFTTPSGTRAWAAWCQERGVALVSGTTGLCNEDHAGLRIASQSAPVLWAPNMSVGVNLLLMLVQDAAARLAEEWDVEIAETHHRHKADAPSGTAKALLEAVCRGRGVSQADVARFGRNGISGERPRGQIGVHALRLGEVVGEHEVHFASAAEVLTLGHRALSRDTFAAGALCAARWIAGKAPGLYEMRDVLASDTPGQPV